jgi:hypothetical protein
VVNSWRLGVVGGLAALCSALSCSDRMAPSDSVEAARQELSSTQIRVLGFESVAGAGGDWTGTSVKLQSGRAGGKYSPRTERALQRRRNL